MSARKVLLVAVLAAAPAAAHDTWLAQNRSLSVPGTLEFELTSGGGFPDPESPVEAKRVARSGLRLSGRDAPLEPANGGTTALRLRSRAAGPGFAAAWIETRPRTLELTPQELAHYLEEVGAADTIGAEWKSSGLSTWRESYVKLAKTLVRLGKGPDDRSWGEPVGLELEIMPERDPTSLRPGESLSFRLSFKGKPLEGLAVGADKRGGSLGLRKTDSEGRVAFAIDAAGPWLIRATRIERAALPDADWRSWFTTLTFDVAP
jgi:uncharacterized GH25 family protein